MIVWFQRVHEFILLLISFDLNPPNVCCLLQVEIFCQQRESQSELKVAAVANYVPLYEAGHCWQAKCVAGSNHLHQGKCALVCWSHDQRLLPGASLPCIARSQHCYCHLYNLPTTTPQLSSNLSFLLIPWPPPSLNFTSTLLNIKCVHHQFKRVFKNCKTNTQNYLVKVEWK
jgi:hypothetical protein